MAVNFQQTDGTVPAGCLAALCSGLSLNGSTGAYEATEGGTAGVGSTTPTLDASAADLACVWFEITGDGTDNLSDYTWNASAPDMTVRLDITLARMEATWESVHVCRVNSSCVSQESLGSSSALGISLGATGVVSTTVTLAAPSVVNAGDKVVVVLGFSNSASKSKTFTYAPTQLIDTPWDAPASEITGDLAVTLDAATLVSAGTIAVAGSASATLDALTLAGAGTVAVVGATSVTFDALTLSATGTVGGAQITGDLNVTLGDLALSAAGTIAVAGSATITLEDSTVAATGTAAVAGVAAITLEDATLSATGVLPIAGDASITLDALALTGAGVLPVAGILDLTLDDLALTSSGGAEIVLTELQLVERSKQRSGTVSTSVIRGIR